MNRLSATHVLTSIALVLSQILLFKNVQIPIYDQYVISILVYPGVILFLPIGIRNSPLILIAFIIGLIIDLFYQSLGIHTAALVLTAFIRPTVLKILEPRLPYTSGDSPGFQLEGVGWFLAYLSILLSIHIVVYFSFDAFSPIFWMKILVNSIACFAVSFVVLILFKMLVK
jgi:hypothetical protein